MISIKSEKARIEKIYREKYPKARANWNGNESAKTMETWGPNAGVWMIRETSGASRLLGFLDWMADDKVVRGERDRRVKMDESNAAHEAVVEKESRVRRAAPKMLAALQRCRVYFQNRMLWKEAPDVYYQIVAAIDAAEGAGDETAGSGGSAEGDSQRRRDA